MQLPARNSSEVFGIDIFMQELVNPFLILKIESDFKKIILGGMHVALTYDLSASITPSEGSPGDQIKLTAKFANASEPVVKAFGTVRMYGWFISLKKESEDTFAYVGTVPYEAPSGRYQIVVYGKAADGSNGPEASVTFTVK